MARLKLPGHIDAPRFALNLDGQVVAKPRLAHGQGATGGEEVLAGFEIEILHACAGFHEGVRRFAGERHDIVQRLERQAGASIPEPRHPSRTCIIGRCGQPEIAEGRILMRQQGGGGGDGLRRVVGVGQPSFFRRGRHELGDALRADGRQGVAVEAAFHPDKTGEEIARHAVFQ